MPNTALIAQQLGGFHVVRRHVASAPIASAPIASPAPAPAQVVTREVLTAAQNVSSVHVSERDHTKVLSFTLIDGTVETVVVEQTSDLETRVHDLALKIAEIQKQSANVATRLAAIEKVI